MSAAGTYAARAFGDNVIALNARPHRQPRSLRLAGHAALFAIHRRAEEDVFWLKENAEYLNILQATGQPARSALEVFEQVYDDIDRKLGHYPQYYRFLLSICLDLEDLGMPGGKGEALCHWVADQNLAGAELSDLQRAEAYRLLARRGVAQSDRALRDRLDEFMARTATFRVPNKKAAYELTHIVFYLSEYGRCDPNLSPAAVKSLQMAGLLAFLDQNIDLLAEICIALRYAGAAPNRTWEGAVARALRGASNSAVRGGVGLDDYHCYAVSSWLAAISGETVFPLCFSGGTERIDMPDAIARPITGLTCLLDDTRCPDWHQVRDRALQCLDPTAQGLLRAAEDSTPHFAEFYEGFARSSGPIRSD